MKTLPPGLEVSESGIPNAGLGVFATKFFPVRTRFGPYEGRRVTDPDIAHSSGYCWQVQSITGKNLVHFLRVYRVLCLNEQRACSQLETPTTNQHKIPSCGPVTLI